MRPVSLSWLLSAAISSAPGEMGSVRSVQHSDRAERVRAALQRLEASQWVLRDQAERELASSLEPEDLGAVAERAAAGAVELRSRLENALASDGRHLELCVLLAADGQAQARELGERSFARQVTSWCGHSELAPRTASALLAELDRIAPQVYSARLGARPFAEECERLMRLAGTELRLELQSAPLGLALDPAWELERGWGGAAASGPSRTGTFAQLLAESARQERARLVAYGVESYAPWIAAVPEGTERGPGPSDGRALLLDWCRRLADSAEPEPQRSAAARALAGTGWPVALAWLERRWLARDDGAALDGLLLAAGRGRVVPSLTGREGFQRALRRSERSLAEGDLARARRAAAGLGRVPSAVGRFGSPDEWLLADWESSDVRGREWRLAIVVGLGRAPAAWRARLGESVCRGRQFDGVDDVFELLRVLAATQPALPAPAAPLRADPALLEAARARAGLDSCLAWVARAELAPVPELGDPAQVPAHWDDEPRWALIEWWSRSPEGSSVAAKLLRNWLATAAPKAEVRLGLHLRGRPSQTWRSLSSALTSPALEPGERARWDHALAIAGWSDEFGCERVWQALQETLRASAGAPLASSDLPLLAACGGVPGGESARAALLADLSARLALPIESWGSDAEGPLAAWLEALDQTLADLRSRRQDELAERLLSRSLAAVSAHAQAARQAGSSAVAGRARALASSLRKRADGGRGRGRQVGDLELLDPLGIWPRAVERVPR
jgi:hypothetical protein